MPPSAHPCPQPKWHIDWFSHFCTSDVKTVVSHALAQNCPFPWVSTPSDTRCLWSSWLGIPNGISIGSAFLHHSQKTVTMLYKLPLLIGRYGPPPNTILWAHPSPQPQWQLDQFSRFYIGHCQMSLYFIIVRPSPSELPLPIDKYWSPSNTWFTRPTGVVNPNGSGISSAVFAWLSTVADGQTDEQTDRQCYSVGNSRMHLCT